MSLIHQIINDPEYFISRLLLLTLGSIISASAVVVFLLPSNIAPAGVSGLAVILNHLFNTPIGIVIIIANIPIQLVAFNVLKGWKTIAFTVFSILLYSLALDLLPYVVPSNGITDDGFLNAVCGGVIGGIGGGLIYRAGGTVGGTSTIAQMLRQKFGLPLSIASLLGDILIISLAGIVLSWESALYALIAVFINRLASDYVLEGPSDTCTALIVTDNVTEVYEEIESHLNHGITTWKAGGGDLHVQHHVLLVSILRSQIHTLEHIMREVDEKAFVTIMSGQVVYGEGFKSFYPQMPLRLDEVEG